VNTTIPVQMHRRINAPLAERNRLLFLFFKVDFIVWNQAVLRLNSQFGQVIQCLFFDGE